MQKCKEEPKIAVCVHACTYTLCSTCLRYYSTRQLNLFLTWWYNLGILKGAQGPPAFMLECLVRNSVLRGGISEKKALSTYHMLLLGLASLWLQFQLCIFQENIITHNLTCLCKVASFVTHPKFCIEVLRLKDRRDVCALPGAVIPPASPLWANVAPQESCGEITAEPQWDMSYGALNERAVPHWAL